jgi:O-glycosyl hydrolase
MGFKLHSKCKKEVLLTFSFISFLLFNIACFAQENGTIVCHIDINKKYQTIDNFGASDCWTVQFLGNWPESKKNTMADWLFSQEMDKEGKPKGIGLSLWRFNIGGGSTEQGEASSIATDWRRAECFLSADGSYNWNKQAGQQWFLQAAKKRGVNQFLGFANTAPVFMTQNGLAFNKGREETFNLNSDKYEAYADFLVQVIAGVQKNAGVTFNYLSPFNEPEWDWKGNSQEGTSALNSEIAKEVRFIDKKLTEHKLNTKIIVSESGQLDYLYKSGTNKPGRDNQIEELFNASSPNYIGNLSHVPQLIAGHAYWTLNPVSDMIEKRTELRKALIKNQINYWQTEVCLMEKIPDVGEGHGRDLSMKTALFFARLIHHDMVVSNASAWHWWLGITYSDYKDGLIYVFPNKDKNDGTYIDSKLLWALGNYSRFIRPGAIRVDATGADINDPNGLMVSAYMIPNEKQLVAVAINYDNSTKRIKLDIPGLSIEKAIPYITTDNPGENLLPGKLLEMSMEREIPSRSVVTFVCTYK